MKLILDKVKVLKEDPRFEAVIRAIELRERARFGMTDLRLLYDDMLAKYDKDEEEGKAKPAWLSNLSFDQTVFFFREMGEAGFGILLEGGRSKPPRFKWGYKIKTVAPALRDPDNNFKKVIPLPKKRATKDDDSADDMEETSSVVVSELAEAVAAHHKEKGGKKAVKKTPVPVAAVMTLSPAGLHLDLPNKLDSATADRLTKMIHSIAS